jgi:hypothetical protein
LDVNADGELTLFAGGQPVAYPSGLRRSGSRGHVFPAPLHPGMVIWWRSSEASSRLAVATDVSRSDRAWLETAPEPVPLAAESIRFNGRYAALRMRTQWHWADARRPRVFRLRTTDGRTLDMAGSAATVTDAKGTLRFELADAGDKVAATFVIDGLRDPWGRTMPGQPLEVPVEPK